MKIVVVTFVAKLALAASVLLLPLTDAQAQPIQSAHVARGGHTSMTLDASPDCVARTFEDGSTGRDCPWMYR